MWASLVKSKILQKQQFWRFFFISVANGHHFQKCQFLKEILSFLKEVSSVFERCQFLVALFSFSKNNILCQKRQFLGKWVNFQVSDKIMSCKLWGKVTSVSVNINFGAKMSILCKKCEILGEMLTFSLSVPYYRKWFMLLQNMPIFFLESVTFLWRFIYINSVKLW